jgi:pimeloyl-ACP methyl ester carboxylesterase
MDDGSTTARRVIGPPDRLLQMAEGRAWFELTAFLAASPLLRMAGRGDRHPVLVLPGFTAGDRSTAPLRAVLRSQGYWVHGWRLGMNMGPTDRILGGLDERLLQLNERHARAVSIIGWSLGGIYARELARRYPESVRQVITLGSPFRMMPGDRSAASILADQMAKRYSAEWTALAVDEGNRPPLLVPSTAIYTRTDGICRWHTCIDEVSETHENIEVRGSHSGLGFNPAVAIAVSDRLAQSEGDWRPFSAPIAVRHLFPRPASFQSVS